MRRPTILATAMLLVAGAGVAFATQPPQQERLGRYTMQPVEGGFLRLDTESGAVSLCTKQASGFACESVPDGRAQPTELERLAAENRELRAEVMRLSEQRGSHRERKFELPSEEDVDKALNYIDRMVKKFRDRFKDLEGGPGKGTPL